MKTRLAALAAICIISPISVNAQIKQVQMVGNCGPVDAHRSIGGEPFEVIKMAEPNQSGVFPVMLRGANGEAVGAQFEETICVFWFHMFEGVRG